MALDHRRQNVQGHFGNPELSSAKAIPLTMLQTECALVFFSRGESP